MNLTYFWLNSDKYAKYKLSKIGIFLMPRTTTPRNTIPPTQSCDTASTSTATGPFPSSSGSADFDLFFQFTPPSDFDSTLATTLGLLGPAPAPFDCDFWTYHEIFRIASV